ncbi:MAG: DUF5003 domain-containing protein, partial [Bacteroidales bacterium]|nr:DUF5003 domain-containing protein [Bacteroidales bacterium]
AVLLGLAGCTQPDVPENPVFPQKQELDFNALEQGSLKFSATHNWKLTSDKIWCTFETPAGNIQNISGTAGENSVVFHIGEEGLEFESSSVCSITMSMLGRTMVIAEIKRAPKSYEFAILDENGEELNRIEAGYSTFRSFKVKANFTFAAVSWDSEVFTVDGGSITGGAGEEVEGRIKINPDGNREKYSFGAEKNLTMVFSDEFGKAKYTYPVVYSGMEPEEMSISTPTSLAHGWFFSPDGKYLAQGPIYPATDSTRIISGCYEFETVCLNDDFVTLAYSGKEAAPAWVHITRSGSKVKVTIDENEGDKVRTFEVWAFPSALYKRLGGTAEALFKVLNPAEDATEEEAELSYKLRNSCLAFMAEQAYIDHSAEDGQLTPICLRSDLGRIPGTWEYDRELAFLKVTRIFDKELIDKFGVKSAYEVNFTSAFFIMPKIEGWNEDSFSSGTATARFYFKDRELDFEKKEFEYQTVTEIYGISNEASMLLSGPAAEDESVPGSEISRWEGEKVYAVFSLGGVPEKLVVINPPVAEE